MWKGENVIDMESSVKMKSKYSDCVYTIFHIHRKNTKKHCTKQQIKIYAIIFAFVPQNTDPHIQRKGYKSFEQNQGNKSRHQKQTRKSSLPVLFFKESPRLSEEF